jgi:hypothetical protein
MHRSITDPFRKFVSNFKKRVAATDVDAGTLPAFPVPSLGIGNDMLPERIGPTLRRATLIHRTPAVPPEHAVMVLLF